MNRTIQRERGRVQPLQVTDEQTGSRGKSFAYGRSSVIHLFIQQVLLNTCYVLGTALGAGVLQ